MDSIDANHLSSMLSISDGCCATNSFALTLMCVHCFALGLIDVCLARVDLCWSFGLAHVIEFVFSWEFIPDRCSQWVKSTFDNCSSVIRCPAVPALESLLTQKRTYMRAHTHTPGRRRWEVGELIFRPYIKKLWLHKHSALRPSLLFNGTEHGLIMVWDDHVTHFFQLHVSSNVPRVSWWPRNVG